MRYERYVMPLTAVAALSAAGVAGYLAWRRRAARAQQAEEPGVFLYGYPLDIDEDEVSIFTAEDLMVDEEGFPGFRQDG